MTARIETVVTGTHSSFTYDVLVHSLSSKTQLERDPILSLAGSGDGHEAAELHGHVR